MPSLKLFILVIYNKSKTLKTHPLQNMTSTFGKKRQQLTRSKK